MIITTITNCSISALPNSKVSNGGGVMYDTSTATIMVTRDCQQLLVAADDCLFPYSISFLPCQW